MVTENVEADVSDPQRVAVGDPVGGIFDARLGERSYPAMHGRTGVGGVPYTRGHTRRPGSLPGLPPRQLSPALRAWALKRFVPRIRWGLRCTVVAAVMSGGVSFVAIYFNMAEVEWLLWVGISWIVLDVGALVGIFLYVRSAQRRRGRQLLALVECGQVRHARVLANQVDYAASANGAPKIVVALEIDGRFMEIRGFDRDDAGLFPPNTMLEVVYAESIPEIVFPTSQIPVI